MRPRTHTPHRKLLRQLIQRRLNASAQPDVKFPKVLWILLLLIASQRRQQARVLSVEQLLLGGFETYPLSPRTIR